MDYTVIRSKRKSLSMQITERGLIVRAPLRASPAAIEAFVNKHRRWAENRLLKRQKLAEAAKQAPLTDEDIKKLAAEAAKVIPEG